MRGRFEVSRSCSRTFVALVSTGLIADRVAKAVGKDQLLASGMLRQKFWERRHLCTRRLSALCVDCRPTFEVSHTPQGTQVRLRAAALTEFLIWFAADWGVVMSSWH